MGSSHCLSSALCMQSWLGSGVPCSPRTTSREQPGWEAPCRAEVSSAVALGMRMQPPGRQGHIPNMSSLNKAIYQHRVDTAELGTESQRALAVGPCGTREPGEQHGGWKSIPCFCPARNHSRACTRSPVGTTQVGASTGDALSEPKSGRCQSPGVGA